MGKPPVAFLLVLLLSVSTSGPLLKTLTQSCPHPAQPRGSARVLDRSAVVEVQPREQAVRVQQLRVVRLYATCKAGPQEQWASRVNA